jgi:transcriptional antiterminator
MPSIKQGSSKDREVKQRRTLVERLYIRRLSVAEIAKQVKVSERTITRDLDLIRQKNLDSYFDLKEMDNRVLISEYLTSMDEVIRESWVSYHQKQPKMRSRVALLRVLKDSYTRKIEFLQTLGYLPSKTNQSEMAQHFENKIEDSNTKSNKLSDDFTNWLKEKYQNPI